MKNLEEKQLMDVAGGATGNHVKVTVKIEWSGRAAQHVNEYGNIKVDLKDSEGKASNVLNLANHWTCHFYVKNHDEFDCFIDLRKYYPNIQHWKHTWNAHTNMFVYYIS